METRTQSAPRSTTTEALQDQCEGLRIFIKTSRFSSLLCQWTFCFRSSNNAFPRDAALGLVRAASSVLPIKMPCVRRGLGIRRWDKSTFYKSCQSLQGYFWRLPINVDFGEVCRDLRQTSCKYVRLVTVRLHFVAAPGQHNWLEDFAPRRDAIKDLLFDQ
ncbi:MAG: hypothetical protein WC997_02140 [Porticoccaceae bacterium]